MRIRLLISAVVLALGLVSTQLPVSHSVAILVPCGNCDSTQALYQNMLGN